jgi:hypothetical protein
LQGRVKIFTAEVVSLELVSYSKKEIAVLAETRVNGATSSGDTSKMSSY